MDANFSKFKQKVWLFIFLKCLLIALAAAVFTVTVVFVPCKCRNADLFWPYYLLIGFGAFLLGGGISFLFLRTNDSKIAQMLDSELGLQERVQTAYEFQGQTGAMFDLQTADASAALTTVVTAAAFKTLFTSRFFGSVKSIVASVLCCAVIATGGITIPVVAACVDNSPPAQQEELPPEEKPRPVTDWEWQALDDLIAYVQRSKADAYTKDGVVDELNALRDLLLDGVTGSSLKNIVEYTATNCKNIAAEANEVDGVSPEQQTLNTELSIYVYDRLYEIFNISKPGITDGGDDGSDNPDPDDGDGDDNEGPDDGSAGGGGLDINETEVFVPGVGYRKLGEIIAEYYEEMQDAFASGEVDEEEWLSMMIEYFTGLNKK